MATHLVKTPDGKTVKVEAPADATPEQVIAYAQENYDPGVLETAKSGGADIVRGGLKTGSAMASAAEHLNPMSLFGNMLFSAFAGGNPIDNVKAAFTEPQRKFGEATKKRMGVVEDTIPTPQGDSTGRQYGRAALEGLGGAVVGAPGGFAAAPGAAVVSSLLGGAGAKFGGEQGASISPSLEAPGALLGGIIGGLPGSFFMGPRQSVAEKTLRQNSQGLNWEEGKKNVDLFSRTDSTSATLPEVFPGRTSLLGLADKTRGAKGGEELATRVANREADLQGLGDKFLKSVGPEVNANQTSGRVTNAANEQIGNLKGARGEGVRSALMGSVRPDKVKTLQDTLRQVADMQDVPGARAAYHEVADRLTAAPGSESPVITNLQTLSLQIKGLKKDMNNPNSVLSQSSTIDKTWLKQAIADAEQGLGEIAPSFEPAMKDYKAFTNTILRPTQDGTIGKLADRNPLTAPPDAASKMNGILSGNDAAEVGKTMATLSDKTTLGNKAVSPQEIARALFQQKLENGSKNPGEAIRGLQGSPAEGKAKTVLDSGFHPPMATGAQKMEPLQAADLLQNYKGLPGQMEMGQAGVPVRPLRWLDFELTDRARTNTAEEIARLLSRPTKENLARLKEIYEFDPSVRRMLMLNAGAVPALQKGE